MKDIYIFDLDGTLADIEHRRHFVTNGNNKWDEFYKACIDDTINKAVYTIINDIGWLKCTREREGEDSNKIWIVSGRSEIVKKETIEWLYSYAVFYDKLIMRSIDDYTPDYELKKRWLNDGTIPKERVIAVFDDRKVVDMWRNEGLTCFQVAPTGA